MIASEPDICGDIVAFLKEHGSLQSAYLEDRGLVAWHIFRKRICWRHDEHGEVCAVMFFWQVENPSDIDDMLIDRIEGRGECIYIPFLAVDDSVKFHDVIGGMLAYAADACEGAKWIVFERMDGKLRQYKVREKHGIF